MTKKAGRMEKRLCKIGILTFHWADNHGEMLQAYGLKTWLAGQVYDPFIINDGPAQLRGRDWLVPYVPAKTIKGRLTELFPDVEFTLNTLTVISNVFASFPPAIETAEKDLA